MAIGYGEIRNSDGSWARTDRGERAGERTRRWERLSDGPFARIFFYYCLCFAILLSRSVIRRMFNLPIVIHRELGVQSTVHTTGMGDV